MMAIIAPMMMMTKLISKYVDESSDSSSNIVIRFLMNKVKFALYLLFKLVIVYISNKSEDRSEYQWNSIPDKVKNIFKLI